MKIIMIILFASAFTTLSISAQNTLDTCNRNCSTNELLKRLPKEICLPRGYEANYSYPSTDMNGDTIKDFIFRWTRKPLKDGDTIFTSIYIQNKNGSYRHLKTFNNLDQIYFKSYDLDYKINNSELNRIQGLYNGTYHLKDLNFSNQEIQINFETDYKVNTVLTFKYNKKRNNWILLNQKEIDVLKEYKVINLNSG